MLSPLYGQLSPLRIPTKAGRSPVSDSDAEAYLQAVEGADGLQLEQGVADAVNSFVLGCKSDGIWSAIKASCILAGARTLSGALVPLVGSAPTNFNFVSADYNRETGLKGDASSKRLRANRNNNADPQNSKHFGIYLTEKYDLNNRIYLGTTLGTGCSQLFISNSTTVSHRVNSNGNTNLLSNGIGFLGSNRSNSTTITSKGNGQTFTSSQTSQAPLNAELHVFSNSNGANQSAGRISFYSIGESLDLALLDTRVSTLMTDLAAAIP